MPTRLSIFIIDASSILSYIHNHASLSTHEANLEKPNVHSFLKMLIKVSKKFNITHIIVIWDGRKDIKAYLEYEADKKTIMEFINSIKMEQIFDQNMSASDLIFSMIKSFNHQHHNVVIVTTNEFLYKLANITTTIINPWKRILKSPANTRAISFSRHKNPTTTARTIFHEKNWLLALPFFKKLHYTKLISAVQIKPIAEYSLSNVIGQNYNYSFQLVVITSEEEIIALCHKIKDLKQFCFNLQGTNLDPMISACLSVSIAIDENTVYYIPIKSNPNDTLLSLVDIIKYLKPLYSDKYIKKIMHYATFNQVLCKQLDMPVHGTTFDIIVAASLIIHNPQENSLVFLSKFYEKNAQLSYVDFLNTTDFIDKKTWTSIASTHQTMMLKSILYSELKKEGMLELFESIEMPVNNILTEMEYKGIYCDSTLLAKINKIVTKKLRILNDKIAAYSPIPININSVIQVRKLLFETLQLPILKKLHTSEKLHKKRQISTDAETLISLSKIHPVAQLILKYRELFKLKQAYLESLPRYINNQTHKIHPLWSQALTATDRISCTHPNLQTIPTRDFGVGIFIRSAFQAQNNNEFIGVSYNDIELHIIAHLSKDKNLKTALAQQHDIHATTAAHIFSTTTDKVTPAQRSLAKKIDLSISYGLTAYGLAQDQHIPMQEAVYAIKMFFDQYPLVQTWMQSTLESAQKKCYVTTLHGKVRYLPNLHATNRIKLDAACRLAISSIIQGSATEIIKIGMIYLDQTLADHNLQAKILLQIHDELILSVPKSEIEKTAQIAQESLESVVSWEIPLNVQLKTGMNWHDVTR